VHIPRDDGSECSCTILLAILDLPMNISGRAVSALAAHYRIPARRILLLYDDLDLPLGVVRVKDRGSDGGHNGVASVIKAMGGEARCKGMMRIKMGVGRGGSDSAGEAVHDDGDAGLSRAHIERRKERKSGRKRARGDDGLQTQAARQGTVTYVLSRFTPAELRIVQRIRARTRTALMHLVAPRPLKLLCALSASAEGAALPSPQSAPVASSAAVAPPPLSAPASDVAVAAASSSPVSVEEAASPPGCLYGRVSKQQWELHTQRIINWAHAQPQLQPQ
jgi:peptidyl-tRNA hydrolase